MINVSLELPCRLDFEHCHRFVGMNGANWATDVRHTLLLSPRKLLHNSYWEGQQSIWESLKATLMETYSDFDSDSLRATLMETYSDFDSDSLRGRLKGMYWDCHSDLWMVSDWD